MSDRNVKHDFSAFDDLPTSALEAILAADTQQSDDNTDLEIVLYITDLLNERAKNGQDVPSDHSSQKLDAECSTPTNKLRKSSDKCPALFVKLMLIALAALAVVFLSIWIIGGMAGTEVETEPSFTIDDQNGDKVFSSLQDALDHTHMPDLKEPDMAALGFTINAALVTPGETVIVYADYYSDQDFVSFCFRDDPGASYEKTGDPPEVFLLGETTCYLLKNSNNYTIVWMNSECECRVAGTLPKEEMIEIVKETIIR